MTDLDHRVLERYRGRGQRRRQGRRPGGACSTNRSRRWWKGAGSQTDNGQSRQTGVVID
jgi:hypothetical protein